MLSSWLLDFELDAKKEPRKGIVGAALRTVAPEMGRGGRWRDRAECDRRGKVNLRRAELRPGKRIGLELKI